MAAKERDQWAVLVDGALRQRSTSGHSGRPYLELLREALVEAKPDDDLSAVTSLLIGHADNARGARVLAQTIDVLKNAIIRNGDQFSQIAKLQENIWGRLNELRSKLRADGPTVFCAPFGDPVLTTGLLRLALVQLGEPLLDADLVWEAGLTASAPILVLEALSRSGRTSAWVDLFFLYCNQGWLDSADIVQHWTGWRESFRRDHTPELVRRHNLRTTESDMPKGEEVFTWVALCAQAVTQEADRRVNQFKYIYPGTALHQTIEELARFTDGKTALSSARKFAIQLSDKVELLPARFIEKCAASAQDRVNNWAMQLGYPDQADGLLSRVRHELALPDRPAFQVQGPEPAIVTFVGQASSRPAG
jgi:hypothetical protein